VVALRANVRVAGMVERDFIRAVVAVAVSSGVGSIWQFVRGISRTVFTQRETSLPWRYPNGFPNLLGPTVIGCLRVHAPPASSVLRVRDPALFFVLLLPAAFGATESRPIAPFKPD
jgi:hypothetical protein